MYYIYRHILPDGKSYVGKTSMNPEARYANGKGYKSCPKFWIAIQKYGWENIQHEILYTTENAAEARKMERKMIEKYNCIKDGYNSVNKVTCEQSSYKPHGNIKVYGKYNKEGVLIKKYIGNKQLRQDGYCEAEIYFCTSGRIKTAYGYIWKIEEVLRKENLPKDTFCY